MIVTVSLQPYPRAHMLALIDFLEVFLPEFENDVEVMFGWAWAMDFHNWAKRTMSIARVKDEVQSAENQDFGDLRDDDLYLWVKSHDLEIHFCHEGDIHVSFSSKTSLVEGILKYLFDSYSTIFVDEAAEVPRVFMYGLPVFLCSAAFVNESESRKAVKLLPWDEALYIEPGEKLWVTGYGQNPGLLKIDQRDDGYVVTSWPECNVRAKRDSETVFDSDSTK